MRKQFIKITKSIVATLSLMLGLQNVGHAAGFTPIAISGFNQDLVVEATAPISLSDVVNVTMDGGTNKSGNTWFERGYMGLQTNGVPFTNGLPPANSLVTNITGGGAITNVWQMPPDYHTNNCIMVGHSGGGRTPFI